MKQYVKPDVYYEDFELSTHVATCAWNMSNQSDKYSCTAISDKDILGVEGVVLFTNSAGCELLEEDYEDYCYTNGGEGNNTFNS